ncbi:MAG: GerMN domain-containing protein [Treponemataceae bacterium]|nr:GerMN domain-containing protein [Treponemataceae bacterium]
MMSSRKKFLPAIISCFLFLLVLAVSIVLFICSKPGVRRVFIFESFDDNREYMESRTVPSYRKEDNVSVYTQYIQELLGGAVTDRYRPLFDTATRVTACMFRDGALYVDLSEEALLATATSSTTEKACEMLKKNILINFSSVRKVYVFINGYPVYEGVGQPE